MYLYILRLWRRYWYIYCLSIEPLVYAVWNGSGLHADLQLPLWGHFDRLFLCELSCGLGRHGDFSSLTNGLVLQQVAIDVLRAAGLFFKIGLFMNLWCVKLFFLGIAMSSTSAVPVWVDSWPVSFLLSNQSSNTNCASSLPCTTFRRIFLLAVAHRQAESTISLRVRNHHHIKFIGYIIGWCHKHIS